MSKVALRLYNREIETLIDQGHIDEAIAHCQHILKTYPKHLETYRLLGKAYLEAHRYPDSADIFNRVLLAVPDDFVSHLGMSIVSDEQKDLDGAIWHMERAFEISSTNTGVQGELRRLRGRRDGMEPPKIQLTRGALAQIYTKGGEYQQAIAEIKAVLAEDSTRSDMKTLLARAYFRAGMRNEATQACIDLLKEYPYNLDANRILVEILPGTSMAQGVDQYKKRIESLDPYLAYTTGSVFNTENIPDNAVTIERLEYDPNAQPAPTWTMPDVGPSNIPVPQATPTPEDQIPDWMKQSGWGQSTGEFKDGPVNFDEPEPESSSTGGELAAAEIPDWLKAMAPPGASTPEPTPPSAPADEASADFDWLAGLGAPMGEKPAETPAPAPAQPTPPAQPPATPVPASADDDQDWLKNLGASAGTGFAADEGLDWLNNLTPPQEQAPSQPAATPAPAEEGLPDWLSTLDESKPAEPAASFTPEQPAPAETTPDWMSGLSAPSTPEAAAPVEPAESVPDWMRDLSAASAPQGNEPPASEPTPDWMSGFSAPETPETTAPSASESTPDWMSGISAPEPSETATPSESVPDWMSGLSAPQTPEATEPVAAESNPDWMNEPSAPQATPEATTPSEAVPDWLQDLSGGESEQPLSDLVSSSGTSQVEQDDTFNWLENLATGPEAKSEELPAKPEEPKAQATGGMGEAEDQPTELSALISGPGTSSSEQDDALLWLESLAQKQGAKPEELITKPDERKDAAPDWVSQVGQVPDQVVQPEPPKQETPTQPVQAPPQPPVAETKPPAPASRKFADEDFVPGPLSDLVAGPGTSSAEQDDALLWLESLAQKQGAKPEELITNPNERKDAAPDWVSQVGQVPDQIVQPEPPKQETPPPPQPPVAETKPPAPVSRKLADEDFVPGPLSDLVAGPGTSSAEQDDALLWLESLAQKQGAKPEELITKPEERKDAAPEWVSQVGQVPDQVVQPEPPQSEMPPAPMPTTPPPAAETQPPVPASRKFADEDFVPGPLSDLVSGPGTSSAEQDDALLWLESLAQKQGAKPEELITNPNERKEVAPEWVAQVGQEPAQSVEEPAAPAETPSAPEMTQSDEALAWLQGLESEETVAAEQPAAQAPVEPEPAAEHDWFKDLEEAATATPTSSAPGEEGFDWLDNLAKQAEETPSELPTEQPEQEVVPPMAEPQAVEPTEQPAASEIPDWLAGFGQAETPQQPVAPSTPEPQAVEPTEEAAAAEVPDWLAGFGQSETQQQQAEPMPWEQEIPVEEAHPEEPAPEEQQPQAVEEEKAPESASVSDWLKSLDVEEQAPAAPVQRPVSEEAEELPDWLKDTSADEQPPVPEPALGWVPSDETPAQPPVEIELPVSSEPVEPTPVPQPAPEPVAEVVPVTPPPAPRPALRQTGMLGGDKDSQTVQRARDLLGRGGLDAAMNEYTKLIKKGKLLEEVIYDLQEAVYSHPVDVIVWQTLGDAFMRSNRLQEALDAYSKAEELLR